MTGPNYSSEVARIHDDVFLQPPEDALSEEELEDAEIEADEAKFEDLRDRRAL